MTAKETINIDLNLHTDQFQKEHLIQKEAFDSIYEKIKERLNNKSNHSSSAFFIHGTRGAGKSCFLNTFTKFLAEESGLSIIELINMDPTKVEIGENILVSIIEALHSKIKKSATHQNFGSNFDEKYEEWRKKLQSLATGIKLLNEKDGCLKSLDDTVALEWGMERVASGMTLAQHFKELVEKASEILKTSAFVIAIDDADTNFKTGKEVLEVIRKYLDIPRLIVIVAGDLKLYTHLVRNIFADELHNSKDLHSESEKHNRIKLLDHMVDQYLKKLFPIKNRIELKTLKLLMQKNDYYIQPFNASVDEIFTHIISIGFSLKNGTDIKEYKDLILDQPIRSIVQFLESLDLQINQDITTKRKISESLISLFTEDLYENNIDTQKMNDDDINGVLESIFDILIVEGKNDTNCYFRPRAINHNLKTTFLTISSNISLKLENNFAALLDYMLQGIGSQFIYSNYVSEEYRRHDSINSFKNYFSIGCNEDSLNWAWHYCGVVTQDYKNIPGTIQLNINTPNRKQEGILYKQLLEKIKSNGENTPVIFYSMVQVFSNNRSLHSSIFIILGLIAKHLNIANSIDSDINIWRPKSQNEKKINRLSKIYESQLNIKSISAFSSREDSYEKEFDYEDEYIVMEEILDSNYYIVQKMENWRSEISKIRIKPSSLLIGKIWTRLYFNILSISGRNKSSKFADIMQIYASSVINAFLVEESQYHIEVQKDLDISSGNPIRNPIELIKKIRYIKHNQIDMKKNFPLTYIVATCPLILGLFDEFYGNCIIEALGKEFDSGLINGTSFNNINDVYKY